ncbi:hypothetical protein [Ferruginibacter sp.]
MKKLMMRFNTENKGNLFWRVIIEGEEHLADNVQFRVQTFTSRDMLPNGVMKWHISAFYEQLVWEGTELTVS